MIARLTLITQDSDDGDGGILFLFPRDDLLVQGDDFGAFHVTI